MTFLLYGCNMGVTSRTTLYEGGFLFKEPSVTTTYSSQANSCHGNRIAAELSDSRKVLFVAGLCLIKGVGQMNGKRKVKRCETGEGLVEPMYSRQFVMMVCDAGYEVLRGYLEKSKAPKVMVDLLDSLVILLALRDRERVHPVDDTFGMETLALISKQMEQAGHRWV